MVVLGILIACCVCWVTVFIALNFYYDTISKNKPESITLRATLISFFIMISLLSLGYCSH